MFKNQIKLELLLKQHLRSVSDTIQLCFRWWCFLCTVESRFLETPRETNIGSRNREVREIEGKNVVFDQGR